MMMMPTVDIPADQRPRVFGHLYTQVLIAIVAGILLGYLDAELGSSLKFLGDLFIKVVKLVITPVIFLTVTTGIADMSDTQKLGRVAVKAFVYFLTFSILALVMGLLIANLLQPGVGMHIDPSSLDERSIAAYTVKTHEMTIVGFLMNIVPDTIVAAFAQGDILQVLFFSILFGLALGAVREKGHAVLDLLHALTAPIFRMTSMLMRLAPIGAFGAMAFTIGKYGISAIGNLAFLVGTFYLAALLFVVVVLGAVSHFNGFSIFKLIVYVKEELLLVLGTSSSEAALPGLMAKLEKAGCARPIVGLVVPTGYSFNLDGTNIYMTLAALFIAQATDTPLSLGDQIMLFLVAMLSSKGAAGVSGAGFITLAATLSVVPSVPVAGMALILGVDRFMSECRALTNLMGNAVATIVIARWERELDAVELQTALSGK